MDSVPQWPAGTLLAMLDEGDRGDLLALGTPRRLTRGELLIREGDTGDEVYVLLSGLVKVSGGTYDGHTTLLAIRVPGDVVGELAALDQGTRSATVQACGDLDVRAIGRSMFDAYLTAHPAAAAALQRAVAAKLRQATRSRVDLLGAPALIRLARILDRLASGHGRPVDGGRRIDVPLSEGELAAMIGSSVASVQRGLAELRRLGLITRTYRHTTVLDAQGLHDLGHGAQPA
jgi:CRP/FNR family cyclic AMP-dependent transcriptional regulator